MTNYSNSQDQDQDQDDTQYSQGAQGSQGFQGNAQQYSQWAQHYQQGNYDQVPHDQLHDAYNQFAQQASPQQVQEATTQGYQQIPQQQHPGIASSLLNMFQQHGLNPQAAGVQTTDPQQMSPQDMARMTQYAQQQQPDALHKLFQPGGTLSNPLVGVAVAGALAYGASQLFKKP